ncbi:monovalent cation/H+ antiporter subunit D family protein [Paralimibaculum aggregatum]|uniref:Monovalent cation/H+ antiporter subunit D family protein n=1 Tax=Paralimibaculum aggregatum TaxID=3036245 RepID=A0ABQ6LQM7_9RHOB|nr:monovalent cation/H+ antiporter subunit D family protein [Limibaculum sp. NKW23]GMG84337.1 monovalent cation/H+ antiporter subunit D family protein [Limibaculum sp. NKW23]
MSLIQAISAAAGGAAAVPAGPALGLIEQLPGLQVALPMLGAVLAALLRPGWLAYAVMLVVALLSPVISFAILHEVLAYGPISYEMGGWEPPVGIEYRIDEANAFLLVLVSIMMAMVTIYAPRATASEIPARLHSWYYAMLLICFCGLQGMAITGDAFNIFVFMEISSLAMYALIAMGKDRRALVAAYQYLVIGTIGATFYVLGIGLAFALTGTLNLVDLAVKLDPVQDSRGALAALAFISVGIGLKLALFPLHLWLPNAYAFAPSVATALIASTATKVAVYILVRFVYSVYGVDISETMAYDTAFVLLLASIAMIAPSLVAVFQSNVKRMLAYSSVAQIGYIMVGVALLNEAGLTGGLSHLFNHAIIKGCLFLAVGCVVYSTGITKIDQMAGLGRTMPLTMGAFVVAGLGLIGVPGTAGFVSKWYLIQGAAEVGYWWLVAAIVIASLIAVFYVGRVVELAWFREARGAAASPRAPAPEMLAVTWALALAVLYFGFQTDISAGVPAQAAEVLLNGYTGGAMPVAETQGGVSLGE